MRNRYIVLSTLLAALTVILGGCSRNPEVAKKKYLESGMKYMEQQKYDSAAIQFKKALQIDPKYAEAHYQLAQADIKLEKRPEAFKEMSQTVELDPTNLRARIDLGGMYMASGPHFYSNAEEQARYVVEKDPNNAEGQVLLGNVLLSQKHLDDALSAFSKAIALKPDMAGAYMNRGAVYAFQKQDELAEKDFRKSISLDPHNLQAYADLAGFLLYKKDAKGAEETYRDEIRNNPDSPVGYLRLAGMMLQQGRKEEGEKLVDELRLKQPSSPEVATAIGDF